MKLEGKYYVSFQDFLVQRVDEEYLIKQSSECKDFLIEAMKYHLLTPEKKSLYSSPRTKVRTPLGLPKVSMESFIKTEKCYNQMQHFSLSIKGVM